MRNNKNRIGSTAPNTGVESVAATSNQKQDFVPFDLPKQTELVDMPTRGLYYPKKHPLHKVDTVEIKFMTTRHEEILTNKSYIEKNVVLERLIQELFVDQSLNVHDLYVVDRDAIMIAARNSGYNEPYSVNMRCPSCGGSSVHTIDLQRPIKEKAEDVDIDEDGTFMIDVPKDPRDEDSDIWVSLKVKMLTVGDVKNMEKKAEKNKKWKIKSNPIKDLLSTMILEVNNSDDPSNINKCIDYMLSTQAKFLREEYSRVVPQLDLTHDLECKHCGEENSIDIPLTEQFFWSNRRVHAKRP